jgi:hypothetical protein
MSSVPGRLVSGSIVRGRVANTVASEADDLFVTVGAFDGHRLQWGPCEWVPAGVLPTRGEPCLVAFDEAETPWVFVLGTASSLSSGTGPPDDSVGVDGGFYLDEATLRLYGPKGIGGWPDVALGRLLQLQPTYGQLKSG